MKIAFSWDDGAPEDLKLFGLHEKYGIPGMFFIPTRNREGREVLSESDIREGAKSKYIEIGGHTENHIYLTGLPLTEVDIEIASNKEYLENCLGDEIKHFCLPGGKYNEEIIEIVRRHYDTVRTADTMNFKKRTDGIIKPAFHFYPRGIKSLVGNSIRNNNGKYVALILRHMNGSYFDILRRIIEQEASENNIVLIWGHSWELEVCQLWEELVSFFQYIKGSYPKQICDYSDLFVQTEN